MAWSAGGERAVTYREAGVDLDAARRLTDGLASLVHGGADGFAGTLPLPPMREPVLVACTDGVGTKVALARRLGRSEGLGQDLVAMSVNDLICTGARPLGFLDYLAVGRLEPSEARTLVAGIAAACEAAGCALLGGETAEHPGVVPPEHLDLAGFAVGVVEREEMLGPSRVQAGDVVVGLASSGLHANGFSLVRALVDGGRLAADPDLLLAPTRLYVDHLAGLRDAGIAVHAAAHITGGGLPGNLPRAMPPGLRPVLRPDAWPRPRAIEAVLATGAVDEEEAWATFNMGLGMCLVLPQTSVSAVCALLDDAHVVGWVEAGGPGLRLDGAGG
jgi:phosphoribosylformylglycinamidine cyclo-ligase